ncbi:energy transducer TonB [Ereboglobus luteus]|nr:energy transducer TonB [Ereboglobus luteus]
MLKKRTAFALLAACVTVLFLPTTAAGKGKAPRVELLKIVEMVEPAFPMKLTVDGVVRGAVDVIIGVDAEGRLDDYLVTMYSKQAFADEIAAVLGRWRFEPTRVDGAPVWTRAMLSFSFEAQGVVITRAALDGVTMLTGSMLEQANRVRVLTRQSELDGPLVVAHTVAPLYPAQFAENGRTGAVTVDFFVDGEGRVRLPVVEGETHPWFANSAVEAILQWRFEPPLKKGRPTVVNARQQFVFGAGAGGTR